MESLPSSINIRHIGTKYLHALSDDFSIWQHSKKQVIDYERGYALDDAARGLLAAIACDEKALAQTYLECIRHACCDFAEPINFFDKNRKPLNLPLSEDALGETYWALAIAANQYAVPVNDIQARIAPYLLASQSLRALAYAALSHDPVFVNHFHRLFKQQWVNNASPEWPWPEHTLYYANALLPLALLATSPPNSKLAGKALQMLTFLNDVCMHEDVPTPIGNQVWYTRTGKRSVFAQQPIDPAYQVWANSVAFALTKKPEYRQATESHLGWFWGWNTAQAPLIDTTRESCFDGISEKGISRNSGAECTVCYLIAQAVYEETCNASSSSAIATLFLPMQRSAAP